MESSQGLSTVQEVWIQGLGALGEFDQVLKAYQGVTLTSLWWSGLGGHGGLDWTLSQQGNRNGKYEESAGRATPASHWAWEGKG